MRSAQRAALARLVPEVGGDGDRVGDPDTERLLLLEGIVELLAAVSAREPVMVVLDDLHWADTASLQVLRHVIASPASSRLTIAITYRDTDLGRGDTLTQLLADLHREANVTRLALHGLEDTDILELLAAAAGHDLDDDGVGLAHALRRETDGNPFFTGELLRHLGESGGIVLNEEGRWVLTDELDELGLPSSVRDVVGRRVERLGDEPLRALTLASVIGREFDVDLLTVLTGIGEDQLLDHLDAAVTAALLTESETAGRYRFTHALTQHSLYDELSATRRQRAHQRVAEALEEQATSEDATTLSELARHWVAATRPADIDKALDYVQRAGDAALAALAAEDAVRWYQQALDLLAQRATPDDGRRARLLAALGTAQRQAGLADYRTTLLRASQLAHDIGRQRHLTFLLPLADHPQQPAFHGLIVRRIRWVLDPLQVIDRGRHHFREPKPGRIKQVQSEGQTLVRRSAGEHLQLLFNETPLRQAETASRIHLRPRGARHLDGRPRVAHQVVLVDQKAIKIFQDGDGVPLGGGRQRPLERPPQGRPAFTPAIPTPPAARLRVR